MADTTVEGESFMVEYSVEEDPDYTINLVLFTDVTNSHDLRQLIVQGKLEATLLNACMVVDPFHVVVAGHKALHLFKQKKMKTRTLHSEIIFNLSPSTNINESFKRFGILDSTSNVLVVMITQGNAAEKPSELREVIKGKLISLNDLSTVSDKDKIRKVYGISDNDLQCGSLESAIITRIATKDAA